MTVYISGPITGKDDGNRLAFRAVFNTLRGAGFDAINPHDIGDAIPKQTDQITWQEFMRADIKAMMDADALFLLPDWRKSRGAVVEVHLARDLGIPRFRSIAQLLYFRAEVEKHG